jgi:hypothetical protein
MGFTLGATALLKFREGFAMGIGILAAELTRGLQLPQHSENLRGKRNAQLGPAGLGSLVHAQGWGSAATAGSCAWTSSFLTAYSTSSTME